MNRRPVFRRLALSLAAAGLPWVPVHADTTEPPVVLDPVTVEATPFKRSADELVQPVDVLQGAELDRKRKSTLGEVLEGELGVSTSDFGPGVGRPIIRGQGGPRVLVLDNGLSTMDAASVSTDHAVTLDPQHATQVEIIKGPATLIYGSNASAGVVNVVDERLPEKVTPGLGGEVGMSYGDNADEINLHGDLDYGVGKTQFHADFARRETNRFEIPGNSEIDGDGEQGRIPNSQVETTSGDVSLTRAGDAGSLGASLSFFESQYGIPSTEAAFIDMDQLRLDVKGVLKNPLPSFEALRLRLGVTDYEHTEFEAPGEAGTMFKNNEQELRLEAQHVPFGGLHGVLGLQVTHRDFEAIGEEAFVPPVETRQIGLFAVEELRYGWGRLEGGVRVEHVEHKPGAATGLPSRDQTPLSLSAGALVNLAPEYHLRLTLSRSERAPSAEEYYAFGPHLATATFERGALDVGKETVNNVEIGLDKHRGRFTFAVNAFYQQTEDYIFLASADCNADASSADCNPDGEPDFVTDEGEFVVEGEEAAEVAAAAPKRSVAKSGEGEELLLVDYRQADARFVGVEGEARYRLLTGPTRLSARVFGDLVRGSLKGGEDLPRITPPRIGTGLEWSRGRTAFNLDYTRVQRQTRVAALETETAGYNLLSADLSVGFAAAGSDVTVFLRGRNLLDEDARRHTSFLKDAYPLPGRSLFAGFKVAF